MNAKTGDYLSLIQGMAVAAGRSFTESQIDGIEEELKGLEWSRAYHLACAVEKTDRLPPNLYGNILSRIDQAKREQKYDRERKWVSPVTIDCASKEEAEIIGEIHQILFNFENSCALLQKFSQYLKTIIEAPDCLDKLKRAKNYYTGMYNKSEKIIN